jgi:hypothetical protein
LDLKIANIVFENTLINHDNVNYIQYYNESIDYNNLNTQIPTMFVGWHFLKKCNNENTMFNNIDILNKVIIPNKLFWEFSFEENKLLHVKGVKEFVSNVPSLYFMSKYNYIDFDPVYFQIKNISNFIDCLPKNIDSFLNLKNETMYLLSTNKIYGINLKLYNFFQINTSNIIDEVSKRSKQSFFDENGEIYQSYYKNFPEFLYLKRYLIAILTK